MRFSGEESQLDRKDPFAQNGVSDPFHALAYTKAPPLAPASSAWLYGANLVGSGDRATTLGTETHVGRVLRFHVRAQRFVHDRVDDLDDTLRRIDDLGGFRAFNHYAWGWAWAGNTPLRLWKRYAWLGGVRTPLITRWPRRIAGTIHTRDINVGAIVRQPARATAITGVTRFDLRLLEPRTGTLPIRATYAVKAQIATAFGYNARDVNATGTITAAAPVDSSWESPCMRSR